MPPKTNEELYEEAERQLIGEAIAETEQEIHDSAFDNAPDDNDSDRSLEEMDPEDVVDDDIEEDNEDRDELPEEGEGEYDDEPPRERQPERREFRIPGSRLKEESDARRAAETRERELQSRLDQLQGRLDAFERTQRQPQTQPQQQQDPPADMFADPDRWAAQERARIMQEVNNRHFNASLADAAEQHGDKFNEAFKELSGLNPADPANVALAQRIFFAPNPGREVMKWHQQQSLMRDIGSDPAAYRERMRQELLADPDFRKELISGMRQDASGNRRTNVQIPPSLNGASGGASHRGRDGGSRDSARTTRSIEREIFDSAWDD